MAATTALMAAGTALGVVGSIQQARYAQAAGEYNAQMARQEASIAQQKADLETQQKREDVRRLKGKQKLAFLSSGLSLSGSALDLLADTEYQGRVDEKIIRHNADTAAWSKNQEAELAKSRGSQQAAASYLGAGETLLSSAGKWNWKKRGGKT